MRPKSWSDRYGLASGSGAVCWATDDVAGGVENRHPREALQGAGLLTRVRQEGGGVPASCRAFGGPTVSDSWPVLHVPPDPAGAGAGPGVVGLGVGVVAAAVAVVV